MKCTKTVRIGLSRICRKLGYSTNHATLVLDGKRDSIPFLLLLEKHFPELLDTAAPGVKPKLRKLRSRYYYDPSARNGEGGWKIKEQYDKRTHINEV